MTTTIELREIAEKLFSPTEFLNVYSLDTLPKTSGPFYDTSLIINTDTHNLPGQHWVAIHARKDEAYYFDSFGQPPPTTIATWLSKYYSKWTSNTRQVQSINSNFCGYFCIHFLYFAKQSYFKNIELNRLVDFIYPVTLSFIDYQSMIVNFMNTQVLI